MRTHMACAIVLILMAALPGCRDSKEGDGDSQPPSVPGSGLRTTEADKTSPKPLATPWLIEVIELNADSFTKPLTSDDAPHPDDEPVWLLDRRLFVLDDLVGSTDTAALKKARIILSDPAVPLQRCQAIAVYTLQYDGKGRIGQHRWYRGLANWPATVPVGKTFTGKEYVFDPVRNRLPFEQLVQIIRLLPTTAGGEPAVITFGLDGEKIVVSLGQTPYALDVGQSSELFADRRQIQVSAKPLLARDVKFMALDGDRVVEQPAENGDAVVEPGNEFGLVDFSTRIQVINHGRIDLHQAAAPANAEEELP